MIHKKLLRQTSPAPTSVTTSTSVVAAAAALASSSSSPEATKFASPGTSLHAILSTSTNIKSKEGYLEMKDKNKKFLRICKNCEKQCGEKWDMERHVKICGKRGTSLNTDIACPKCDTCTRNQHSALEHYANAHSEYFLYVCESCSFHCNFQSRMSSHKGKCPNDSTKFTQKTDKELEEYRKKLYPDGKRVSKRFQKTAESKKTEDSSESDESEEN